MAFALLSRSRSKPQGSVKPVPKRKSARGQHAAHSRFGFAKPVSQPPNAALSTAPVIQTKLKVGEPNDEFEQEADRVAELTENGNGSISPSAAAQSRSPVGNLQRLYGNQPMLQMRHSSGGPPAPSVLMRPSHGGILQRKCACGGAAGMSGECEECSKKKRLGLQTKLKVNEPGDVYEREADRIADQVLAIPVHTEVSGAPPRIQRFSGQSNGQMDAAPASVDEALVSPGRPLEPALQQDMEQRFGYDFSQVRVHSGAAAEQSARQVNANAYTVGHDIVFGAGRFAPGTHEGRRLIAHELTHVVQQLGADGNRVGQNNEKRGLSPRMEADRATGAMTSQAGFASRAASELQAPGWTIQREADSGKAKALPLWTVDELKKMLDACDGGLGIWAKAKKANNDKDPQIVRGSTAPLLGFVELQLGKITLEQTLDKCGAVQVLVWELSNLSRKADFDEVECSALAGDVSRDEYIWRHERIERETSLVNEIHVFNTCKDRWRCEPHQRVSKPGLLYLDFDEYLAVISPAHKERIGKWWDQNYKTAYTALYFSFPLMGKPSRPPRDRLSELQIKFKCGGKPRGEQVDWERVWGEQVTEETLGVWLRIETKKGAKAKELEQYLLGSHRVTGSQKARKYWADFMRLHFDDLLKAGRPAR